MPNVFNKVIEVKRDVVPIYECTEKLIQEATKSESPIEINKASVLSMLLKQARFEYQEGLDLS